MSLHGKVFFLTITTWLPILPFFYLPNTFWGILIKIVSGFILASSIYDFVGPRAYLYGSAGGGFILNALWFTIINFHPPRWIGFCLWFLIIGGLATSYKILKRMEYDKTYKGGLLYDEDQLE